MVTLTLSEAHQVFGMDPQIHALRGITLTVQQGEFVAVVGPSGSGKSTLLNDLALLHTPTSGDYLVDGESVLAARESRRSAMRSRFFGFVFQAFHLLDGRPVVHSVELGMLYRGIRLRERRTRALAALRAVGMEHLAGQRAQKLSGGERQRVAIARALAVGSPVILADEPTGNLDSANGEAVVDLLENLAATGHTVVLVTHDEKVAARAHRCVEIRDGRIVADRTRPGVRPASPATAPVEPDSFRPAPVEPDPFRPASAEPTPAGGEATIEPGHPGRAATMRPLDVLRDAWASLLARPGRTVALVSAVAVAVALGVCTAGLSQSAAAQVSERFDARRNTQITAVEGSGATPDRFAPAQPARALKDLAGVTAAGTIAQYDGALPVATAATSPLDLPLFGVCPGTAEAGQLEVAGRPSNRAAAPGSGEVLIGRHAANDLDLGPLSAGQTLLIQARPYAVVGVIEESPRFPALLSGIVLNEDAAKGLGLTPMSTTYVISTVPGAAPSVARQAPLVLRPTAPGDVDVESPPRVDSLRGSIESDLRIALLVITAVAALASVIGLANSMVLSVIHRAPEFGLRRALGARPRHIISGMLAESAIIGTAGGLLGLALGLAGILAVTLSQRWQPVFDLALAPVAVLGGVAVGAVSGFASAIRAARIEPADALRS